MLKLCVVVSTLIFPSSMSCCQAQLQGCTNHVLADQDQQIDSRSTVGLKGLLFQECHERKTVQNLVCCWLMNKRSTNAQKSANFEIYTFLAATTTLCCNFVVSNIEFV